MNRLLFSGEEFYRLRRRLLESAPFESAGVLLCERASGGVGSRLIVTETVIPSAGDYDQHKELRIDLKAEFVALILKKARDTQRSIVFAHTHPFASDAWFSEIDVSGEEKLAPSMFGRVPAGPHGWLVLTRDHFAGRLRFADGHVEFVDSITSVGRSLSLERDKTILLGPSSAFDRTVRALGPEGQRLLGQIKVAVVGVGGVGSIVTEQLAHLGVQSITIVDDDILDASNLNRVVGATEQDIGRPKVDVIAEAFGRVFNSTRIARIKGSVLHASVATKLLEADLVMCCTDSHGSRAVLNQLAYQYFLPMIDTGVRIDAPQGAINGIHGRIQLLAPGLPCLVCEGMLDSEQVRRDLLSEQQRRDDPYIVGDGEPQPAVISINGTIGSLSVTMLMAVAAKLPLAYRHLRYDGLRGSLRAVESRPVADCVVCAPGGALGRGSSWQMPWRMNE